MRRQILSYGDTTAWDTYRLGETEFTRVQENWEMPCGTKVPCGPSYRTVAFSISAHPAASGERRRTAWGISGKDPVKTVLYYEPLVK